MDRKTSAEALQTDRHALPIYFLSDCHLGAATLSDPMATERRVVRFLEDIEPRCSALYLLGDIIDYWFEYRHVVPQGFTRFLGQLGRMADRGVEIHWFTGNHDIWIFDYLPAQVGCHVHRQSELITLRGKTMLLAHGDGLGADNAALRLMTGFFHNRLCQRAFRWIHPDLATGFAHWWSHRSRVKGELMPDYLGEEREPLVRYAKQYLAEHPESVDYFVFGHRHIELDLMLSRQSRMFILGDWITHCTYATMDAQGRMCLENWHDPYEPSPADLRDLEADAHPDRQGVSIAF